MGGGSSKQGGGGGLLQQLQQLQQQLQAFQNGGAPAAHGPGGAACAFECLFWPDPALPCRNGANCRRQNCTYAHQATALTRCVVVFVVALMTRSSLSCATHHQNNNQKTKPKKTSLLQYLSSAKRSLDVCVYSITCDEIANCLLDAHRRGVAVRVVSDDEQVRRACFVCECCVRWGLGSDSVWAGGGEQSSRIDFNGAPVQLTGSSPTTTTFFCAPTRPCARAATSRA